MTSVVIRPIAGRGELEACYDLWAEVFPEDRAYFQRRVDLDPACTYETTWAAFVDGSPVSAVQIFPYETTIDCVRLRVGGIGNVATRADHRGQGLARAILRAQRRWMREAGYHASLLFTNIHAFYESVGWVTTPEERWVVDREVILRTEHETPELQIRPCTERDLGALRQMYDQWSQGRSQARQRSLEYWMCLHQWTQDPCLVAEAADEIVAYARVRLNPPAAEVRELVCQAGQEWAMIALLRTAAAMWTETPQWVIRVPEDHAAHSWMYRLGATKQRLSTMMWSCLDTGRLLRTVLPIVHRRAQNQLSQSVRLLLECTDGDWVLAAGPTGVDVRPVEPPVAYDDAVRVGSAGLLHWVLYGFEPDAHECNHVAGEMLRVLFPRQPGLLWSADFF